MPELTNDTALPPGRQGWGLGLHLTLDGIEGMRRPGTGDWAGLFNCYFWIDPAADVAGAIFSRSGRSSTPGSSASRSASSRPCTPDDRAPDRLTQVLSSPACGSC